MHELSLVASLCARAEKAARAEGAQRVVGLSVRLGALSHLSPEHLRDHLAQASVGSMLEGATVAVTVDTDPASPTAQGIELLSVEVE
ncbi:MAG: hydrogenase maturation nickel metallochaperone HypA [Acidimicrobiia bacterium]|nr:hydrogenase maturation nickel metallochaperone HypA [Acidimicrobiia bacterium]